MRNFVFCFVGALLIVQSILLQAPPALAQMQLPAGLSDPDPLVRQKTIENAGRTKFTMTEGKIAAMAQTDLIVNVRKAACLALADMGAVSRIGLLKNIAENDPDPGVRAAASEARQSLLGKSGSTDQKPDKTSEDVEKEYDKYRQPSLSLDEKEPTTRYLAIGFGSMGGYGIAAMDVRGRIPTKAAGLPWIGIELGGGWTPPGGYQLTAGPVGDVNHDKNKWRIISAAGSVLFYFYRMHYIPLRVGWDIGRGVYTMLGYGFEYLNVEGFFSWGVEAGILYQPVIKKKIDKLVVCDEDNSCTRTEFWPVIPYVRFSLHFYPM
ncbi:MAG: HEAT repeat domain-containing protein [Proteobacteria bacterium]|nr:HEAT repeat domain-containing protein [Pseudomonadota bacterium]